MTWNHIAMGYVIVGFAYSLRTAWNAGAHLEIPIGEYIAITLCALFLWPWVMLTELRTRV